MTSTSKRKPKVTVDIQRPYALTGFIPTDKEIKKWAKLALNEQTHTTELTVRLVSIEEMTQLNQQFRSKKGPTNVLSFPFETPANVQSALLGDIIICVDVVNTEAQQQRKSPSAHWAHMIIHGVLHLLGHDHIEPAEAETMETIEIMLMRNLGFTNPYET